MKANTGLPTSSKAWKVLDAIEAHVAILDADGRITHTNKAWNDFAASNTLPDDSLPANVGIGTNYLAICKASTGRSAENSQLAYKGIKDVLAGKKRQFSLEYPCHSPHKQRWFTMKATTLPNTRPREVVIVHTNITNLKLAEIETQRKTAELATALEYLQNMAGQIKNSIALERPSLAMAHPKKSNQQRAASADAERLNSLSQREKEVLLALVRGERNADISVRLHLSPKSISTYRARVLEKLKARSNAELVAFVTRLGVGVI